MQKDVGNGQPGCPGCSCHVRRSLHWQFALDQFSYREAVIQNSPGSDRQICKRSEMSATLGITARQFLGRTLDIGYQPRHQRPKQRGPPVHRSRVATTCSPRTSRRLVSASVNADVDRRQTFGRPIGTRLFPGWRSTRCARRSDPGLFWVTASRKRCALCHLTASD
jgi:hypothetical protein